MANITIKMGNKETKKLCEVTMYSDLFAVHKSFHEDECGDLVYDTKNFWWQITYVPTGVHMSLCDFDKKREAVEFVEYLLAFDLPNTTDNGVICNAILAKISQQKYFDKLREIKGLPPKTTLIIEKE